MEDAEGVMERYCKYIYTNDETGRIRTQAILYNIYHLALHDKWFQARDLMLMSHLQESIHNADIVTQIIYNRTMVQLGLCAFRKGQMEDAHQVNYKVIINGPVYKVFRLLLIFKVATELVNFLLKGSQFLVNELRIKNEQNDDECSHITLISIQNYSSVSISFLLCSLKFHTWPRRNSIIDGKFIQKNISRNPGTIILSIIELINNLSALWTLLAHAEDNFFPRRTVSADSKADSNLSEWDFFSSRMISKQFHYQLRNSEKQAFVGPPDNMREHVLAAAKALKVGDWKKCIQYLINPKMNQKVWNLFAETEKVKNMLIANAKKESLRVYLFSYSQFYDNISQGTALKILSNLMF